MPIETVFRVRSEKGKTKGKTFTQVILKGVISNVKKNLDFVIKEIKEVITIDELPIISADEIQMVQLFQNLISNGIKFSPKSPRIYIASKSEGDQHVFSVRDKGMGIEP